jgi:hypothetical protein
MVGSGVEDAVRAARADGKGIRRLTRELKIGTVQRIVDQMPTHEVLRRPLSTSPVI